jgi:hypothetical protein
VIDIEPRYHMDPVFSLVLFSLLVVGLISLLIYGIALARKWLLAGRAADQAGESGAPLATGEGLVCGVVELDEGTPFAVVVEVHQIGQEKEGKGGWRHSWKENQRRTFTNPFWLRHSSGERVRVLPGEEVTLIDRTDIVVHDLPTERFRIVELSAGETVIVKGVLASETSPSSDQGYRESAPRTWVLRQALGEKLQLTAEKLGDHHRRYARSFIKRIVFGWIPCTLLAAALCGPYLVRVAMGEHSSVLVESKHYSPQDEDTGPTWSIVYRELDGAEGQDPFDFEDWEMVLVGDMMAFVFVPEHRGASIAGAHSTLYLPSWLLAFFVVLTCFGIVSGPPPKLWYEEESLVENGAGRLSAPKSSARRVYSRDL